MTVTPQDLADTLRKRHRAIARAEADERREVRRRLDGALAELADRLAGTRVWLVGSLTHEGWGVRSDIDLVVEGLEPGRRVELERELGSRLRPPVEVLRLEELPASFRERVLQEGILLRDR